LYDEEYRTCHRKNPELIRMITEMEEEEYRTEYTGEPTGETIADAKQAPIHPRFAQIDALDALAGTLEEEYDKAMVVMATGLGKTYLAGFFAQRFERVLFVAHREEIINQAKRSFQRIMPNKTFGSTTEL
jgi:superfamily II DNA or RNA helicase